MKLVRVFHYLCMDSFMNEIKSVAEKTKTRMYKVFVQRQQYNFQQ